MRRKNGGRKYLAAVIRRIVRSYATADTASVSLCWE